MSGSSFFGNAQGILSGAQSLLSLLSGNPGTTVSVGGVPLAGWSMPQRFGVPGEQHILSERIPGGQETIQCLGYFEKAVMITGSFDEPGAFDASEELRSLCASKQPVTLVCGETSRIVIVTHYTPDQRWGWVDYTLEMKVVPPAPGNQPLSGPYALQSVASDDVDSSDDILGTISGLAAGASAALSVVSSGLATCETVLGTAGALTGVSGLSAISSGLTLAQTGVAATANLSESALNSANSTFANGFPPGLGTIPAQAAPLLTSTVAYGGTLAGAQGIAAYLSRTARNVAASGPLAGATPAPGVGVASA